MPKSPLFQKPHFLKGLGILLLATLIGTCGNSTPGDQNSSEAPGGIAYDFDSIPLGQLIGRAEVIVIGRVEGIYERSFKVYPDEVLKGEGVENSLFIRSETIPEAMAPLKPPYSKGQTFTFFLISGDDGGEWRNLGYGREGGLPIENGYIYFRGYDLEGFDYGTYSLFGVETTVQRFPIGDFKAALADYLRCVRWALEESEKNGKIRSRWVPTTSCSGTVLENLIAKGPLQKYLLETTFH